MGEAKPRLSVVMPTLGRQTVVSAVESLLASRIASEVEVLVVGKVREPSVAERLEKIAAGNPAVKLLPLSFDSGDSSRKKTAGLDAARADIVAFVDDDVLVARDWPERILEAFDRPEVGMVSGPSLVPDDLPLMARLAGSSLASRAAGYVAGRYLKGGEAPRRIKWSRIIGCNMAFRREVIRQAGAFDPRFWPGEEMVAAFNVSRLGREIVFHPGACLHHYPRASLGGFLKQIFGYGATRVRLMRHGLDFEPAVLIPGLLVLLLVALDIAAIAWQPARLALAVGILLYLLLDLAVSVLKAGETRRTVDLLIFFVVPLMHLSYGLGEWCEFLRPWRDLSVKQRRA